MLTKLTHFLSNRSQHVIVDGYRSILVKDVSGVQQGNVLGPVLFLLYTSKLFSILENKLIGYANDSALLSVVLSPGVIVTVAESPNCDLGKVSEWCNLWGKKLNAGKTKTKILSRSCTLHNASPVTPL